MGITSKIQLSDNKFFQESGTTLSLSGITNVRYLNYLSDVSNTYDSLSIPNVGFVTGLTNTIEAKLNVVSADTITNYNLILDLSGETVSAANGLSKIGNKIILGGSLTGTTTINGSEILNINVSDFNITGTTVDVTGVVTLQSTPATGDTSDTILVWNSVDKQIKQINSTNLGENNNRYAYTGVSNSIVNLTGNEYVVLVDTSLNGVTINLPASPVSETAFKIKDTGNALTNNITVSGNGNNIDGSSSISINTNYGAIELIYNGTEWYVISFVN